MPVALTWAKSEWGPL